MGNTCASVPIALTGTIDDTIDGIVRAYAKLGFDRTKTESAEGGKTKKTLAASDFQHDKAWKKLSDNTD